MPLYYPLHLDLTGRLCLVVGGGPVAERKVRGLLDSGARVRVVCLEATEALQRMAARNLIDLILAPYDVEHLDGVCLAFAATDQSEINARIAADARAGNVWTNRADSFASGDFIVPAVVRSGEFCLSVSTGGNQPILTARIAAELQERFGPDYGDYITLLGQMREEIKARFASPAARRAAMETLVDAELFLRTLLKSSEPAQVRAQAWQLIATHIAPGESDKEADEVAHKEAGEQAFPLPFPSTDRMPPATETGR